MVDFETFREKISEPGFRLPITPTYRQTSETIIIRLLLLSTEVPTFPIVDKDFIVNALEEQGLKRGSIEKNHLNYLCRKDVGVLEKPKKGIDDWRIAISLIDKITNENGKKSPDTNTDNGEKKIVQSAPIHVSDKSTEKPEAKPENPGQSEVNFESLDKNCQTLWNFLVLKSKINGSDNQEQRELRINFASYDTSEKAFANLKDQGIEKCKDLISAIARLESQKLISTTLCTEKNSILIVLNMERMIPRSKSSGKTERIAPIKKVDVGSDENAFVTADIFRSCINTPNFSNVNLPNFSSPSQPIIDLFTAISRLDSFPFFHDDFLRRKITKLGLHGSCMGYLVGNFIEKFNGSEWRITDEYINAVLRSPIGIEISAAAVSKLADAVSRLSDKRDSESLSEDSCEKKEKEKKPEQPTTFENTGKDNEQTTDNIVTPAELAEESNVVTEDSDKAVEDIAVTVIANLAEKAKVYQQKIDSLSEEINSLKIKKEGLFTTIDCLRREFSL